MRIPVSTIVSIPALSVSVFGAGMFLVSYGWFNVPFRYAMGWFGVGMLVGLLISLVIWTPMLFRDERKQRSVVYSNETAPVPEMPQFGIVPDMYGLRPRYKPPNGITMEMVRKFGRLVLEGTEIKHATMAGKYKPFQRDEYEGIRAYAMAMGWVNQRGDGTFEVTGSGIHEFEWMQNLLPTKVRGTRNYRS